MRAGDFWADQSFRAWLCAEQNRLGILKLCEYMEAVEKDAIAVALRKGDTDFEKGRAEALKDLRSDITTMQSDTGTGTGKNPTR
jgi:hypothetical protein